ncbi:MAG: MFS transporter [Chloroflexi bacterium]|nr:MFS transporter [Chloroflexota bacterium]
MTAGTDARRAFWLLTSIGFLVYLSIGTASPFTVLYIQTLQGSLASIGWVTGGGAVAGLLANIVWGRFTDSTGRRKPFITGAMVVLAVSNALMAHVGIWWLLIPLVVVSGIASAAYNVCALAALGDLLTAGEAGDRQRGQRLGIYRTGGSLAFAIAIVLSGLLVQRLGFQVVYNIASLVYAVTFVVSLFLPEVRAVAPAPSLAQHRELGTLVRLAFGPLLPLVFAVLAWDVPFSAVYSVWAIYIANHLGFGSEGYARLWGLAAFLEVPSMIIAGRLADRWGRQRMFLIGFVLFAIIYGIYTFLPSVPTLVLAQMLRGFAYATITATALTAVVELAPRGERGRAAGVYQLALGLAQIAGNSTGGPAASLVGFGAFFVTAAVITLSGAGVLAVTERRSPQRAN